MSEKKRKRSALASKEESSDGPAEKKVRCCNKLQNAYYRSTCRLNLCVKYLSIFYRANGQTKSEY